MKCHRCGTLAMPEDQFCGACGAKLEAALGGVQTAGENRMAATQASLNTAFLHYRLGLVYYKQGKLKQAIATWEQVLVTEPDHQEANNMLSRARLEMMLAQ